MNHVQRVIIRNAVDSGLNNMGSHLQICRVTVSKSSLSKLKEVLSQTGDRNKVLFYAKSKDEKEVTGEQNNMFAAKAEDLRKRMMLFFHTREIPGLLSKLLANIGKISAFEVVLKNTNSNWWVNYNKSIHLCSR